MLLSDYALSILTAPRVEAKLAPPPPGLEFDRRDFPAGVPQWPARPPELEIVSIRQAKVPDFSGWAKPKKRRRILHALANHELQAVELFAWALVVFPQAPAAFRRGLLGILDDEQRHTRMYVARLQALGAGFGDYPVSGYFWKKAPSLTSPARFICAMSLTFENANLDHTLENARAARRGGDFQTAAVIDQVHADEVEHVRFGWSWLNRFRGEDQSMWESYRSNLAPPLHAGRASGRTFHPQGRRAAGMDEDFIARLGRAHAARDPAGRSTDP